MKTRAGGNFRGQQRSAAVRLLVVMSWWMLVAPGYGQLLRRSAASDVAQGAEAAKLVEEQMGICSLPKTEAWLREVGSRLVAAVDDPRWQFSFHIVDQAEPNAFAIPGGGVYVSRGLLALVNREDELAGVLGHEIAHVTRRHSARQQRRGILPGLLTVPGNIVGNVVGENLGALINAPIEAIGGIGMGRYSRGQETEADRIGTRTAAAAGYEPLSLADLLLRIENDIASQTGRTREASLFDSHPMTDTRLKEIHRFSSSLTPVERPRVTGDTASLFARLDGLWWGENPETGVLRGDQFLHPLVGFTITLPKGWEHENTPRYVVSSDPAGEAILIVGLAGPDIDPLAAGEVFVAKMRSRARVEPVSVRDTPVDGHPVYVATYLDQSSRTPYYLHFVWTRIAGMTYQLIGLAPPKLQETLRSAALSLRTLSAAERRAVTGTRLRIATARKGERLEELCARTGNAWTPDYTALVSGLEVGAVLREGQPVKIARDEPAL